MALTTPRRAAGLMIVTRDGRVLVGKRTVFATFLPGFVVFPGGRVQESDEALARALFQDEDLDLKPLDVARATALREAAEEAGVTLDRARVVSIPSALSNRSCSLSELRSHLGAETRSADLALGGRFITPEFSHIRLDTQFFLARVETPCEATPRDGELEWVRFEDPRTLLREWRRHQLLIAPPTRCALEILALGLEDAATRLSAIPISWSEDAIEFEVVPGVRQIPLLTPTPPPALHTNTYVIGSENLVIVDPATPETAEREKLIGRLRTLANEGRRVREIILTHHHIDHVGAATWLARELDVPIAAHSKTKMLLEAKKELWESVRIDRELGEGDRIDLGRDDAGQPFELEVLFTPGHAPGHIVLVDRRQSAPSIIAGDMVASVGTIIIDPPEGDMAEYLRQLERLLALHPGILFPAHGPAIPHGPAKLEEYLAHRRLREDKVLAALVAANGGGGTEETLLPIAYDDTDPAIYFLAARSCLAHLEKLEREGRAIRRDGRFYAQAIPQRWRARSLVAKRSRP